MSKNVKIIAPQDIERFSPKAEEGLSDRQVVSRVGEGAVNVSTFKPTKSYLGIVIENVFTLYNLVCALTIVLLAFARAPFVQFIPVLLTVLNIFSGIGNGISAKKKLDKLTLVSADDVKVMRGGKLMRITTKDIVLDDIIYLEDGVQIPVDCILLSGALDSNEALLTGESAPVKKTPGDFLYGGAFVVSGHAYARADKIADDTYVAKLAEKAKKYKKSKSEIVRSTNLFLKVISAALVVVVIASFFVSFFALGGTWPELGNFFGMDPGLLTPLSRALQLVCYIIIGALPGGILFINTLSLAGGIIQLYKHDTLVQDMNSMEMLARVNVLCLDKTGTITDGNMNVAECNVLAGNERDVKKIIGNMLAALKTENSTSAALARHFSRAFDLKPAALLPFSSARKFSAVTFGKETYAFGAPDFIFDDVPAVVKAAVAESAGKGLRVIVLAKMKGAIANEKLPGKPEALAVIALQENIRPDAIETIRWFKDNDVAIKVISGDNPLTVSKVAARAGVDNAGAYISLDGLTDEEVESTADKYTVFGRVSPDQKAVLVKALKHNGFTVGMTGDGVNDILAMRQADCAISLDSGSNAAKSVSNLLLLNNNFAAMPKIVQTGRRIINNIKDSTVLYLIKTFFIFMVAAYCVCSNQAFFFTPSNAFTFECFTIGMCSFLLSQQPSKARAGGRFMPDVVRRSLPAALTMFLGILAVSIVYFVSPGLFDGGANGTLFTEVLIVVLTMSGIMMLFHTCQPVNLYKSGVVVLVLLLCVFVLALPFAAGLISDNWNGLIDFNGVQLLIIGGVVFGEYPVLVGISAVTDIAWNVSEKTREMTSRTVYYTDELNDEFSGVHREKVRVDADFKYNRHRILFGIFRAVIYKFLIRPFSMLYMKLVVHQTVVGREKLKVEKGGYFLYANHTNMLGDAFNVCVIPRPKFAFAVVTPENLSGFGMETFMMAMGTLPVPTEYRGMKNFTAAVKEKAEAGHPVYVYPEAHIWPYYTGIRPFTSVSFNYPVMTGKPAYVATATYQKRRFSKKPRMTLYIDGPFYPDNDTPEIEKKTDLRNKVYNIMTERSQNSSYEYIRYKRREIQ